MKRATILAVLFVCAAGIVTPSAQVQAPKDYLEIGSAKVYLDMTKARVAEVLKSYSVTIVNSDDSAESEWLVSLAPGELAWFYFTPAGRLSQAIREWPIRDGDVAGTIFAVISHWERERAAEGRFLINCGVHTDVAASPGATFQRASIVCGQKAVVIMKNTSGTQPQGVAEVLGERRP